MKPRKHANPKVFRRIPAGYMLFGILPLSACGGGDDEGGGPSERTFNLSGEVVKGPVSGAIVFVDYNGDGQLTAGEPLQRTSESGGFSFLDLDDDGPIIALTDGSSVDTSSGLVIDGMRLTAPEGASVISPLTTIMEEGNLSNAQVVAVLNLPDVDLKSFNPFTSDEAAATNLAVEIAAQQVSTVLRSISTAMQHSGVTQADAAYIAAAAVADTVASVGIADFTSNNFITMAVEKATSELSYSQASSISAISNEIATAAANVNEVITASTDLTSTETKDAFGLIEELTKQIGDAITNDGDASQMTFTDANTITDQQTLSETDTEPRASLTLNLAKLEELETVVEEDVAKAAGAISGFYDGTGSRLTDQIETFLVEFELGDIEINSNGIILAGTATGQEISLQFNNFSPSSLQGLSEMIEDFDNTQDLDSLNVSGGFSSFSISNLNGDLVELAHTSSGIEWRNPNALQGDVDTFIIEGVFGNQIADYINILNVAQNSSEAGVSDEEVSFDILQKFSDQLAITGVSAKADGNLIFRIGEEEQQGTEALELFISGSDGNHHEIVLALSDPSGAAADFLTDSVVLDDLLNLPEASSSAINIEDNLLKFTQLLDGLQFSISYTHGSTIVIDASIREIVSLDEAFALPDGGDDVLIFDGYVNDGIATTEIRDPEANLVLTLVGVQKQDFVEQYTEQENNIFDTIDLYLPQSTYYDTAPVEIT